MPELPEVEVLARELKDKLSGLIVSTIAIYQTSLLNVAPEKFEEKIRARKICAVSRKGKFLKFELEGQVAVWFHLGMTGQFIWSSGDFQDKHLHCAMTFKDNANKLFFRDIRKFGQICLTNGSLSGWPEGIRSLGPDPFEISEEAFSALFGSRRGRIKSLLMNQRLLAGLGNIYADECLFRAGIHPRKRAVRLSKMKLIKLHQVIVKTLKEAILKGGSSIDDFRRLGGAKGSFQECHQVYGRKGKPCFNCGSAIRRVILSGRSSHFCPTCQK